MQRSASLDQVRGHFRRFTMTIGPNGQRQLFRFWDPTFAGTFLESIWPDEAEALRWARTSDGAPVRIVVPEPAQICRAFQARGTGPRAGGAFEIPAPGRDALRARIDQDHQEKLTAYLRQSGHFNAYDDDALRAGVDRAFWRRDRLNVSSANGLSWLVILSLLEQRAPIIGHWIGKIEQGCGWSFDQIARMIQRKGEM